MASDNRDPSTQNTQTSPKSMSQSYANVTANPLPRKDQAIVIDSIEGASIDEYVDVLEKLINVNDVKSISKIFGGRVCIYLSNKSIADQVCDSIIKIKNNALCIKPLIGKNKRVVVSNVQSHIPNNTVIEALNNQGITIVSQMYNIKASLSKPGRTHIQSFRRQVYIKESDEELLPESLQINYENTTYWLYLSTDATSCFACKQTGHVPTLCPNTFVNTTDDNTHSHVTTANIINNQNISYSQDSNSQLEMSHVPNSKDIVLNETNHQQTEMSVLHENKGLKRNAPPSTSSEDTTTKVIIAEKTNTVTIESDSIK